MNVAVGGNFPGVPNPATQFPAELVVDYVRVYDRVGVTASPRRAARAGCHTRRSVERDAPRAARTGVPVTSENHKLSVTEKIGYGFGDLASNMFWQMFAIFMAKFYTDVFLLGAATMGTMMLVTRIVDAFFDPMIGTIADRTETRWGHFRPYLVWMAVPMAVTAVLAFSAPSFGGTARIVYAYVTLMLMMFAYSAINIPYSALLGVLTPDSKERTSVTSYRFVMALIPVFIIVNATMPLVRYFGGSDTSPYGWQMTMLVYSVIAVLLFFADVRDDSRAGAAAAEAGNVAGERSQGPAPQPAVGRALRRRHRGADLRQHPQHRHHLLLRIRGAERRRVLRPGDDDRGGRLHPRRHGDVAAREALRQAQLLPRLDVGDRAADHRLLLRPAGEHQAGLGGQHDHQFLRCADCAAGLGDVCRHGRLLGVEVGPPGHRTRSSRPLHSRRSSGGPSAARAPAGFSRTSATCRMSRRVPAPSTAS